MKNKILFLAVVIIGSISLVFLQGMTLMLLWKWFVVPLGVPPLGVFHATGLNVLLLFANKETMAAVLANKDDNSFKRIVSVTSITISCLFFGWIFHFFV